MPPLCSSESEEDLEEESDEESVMPKLWYKRARARCSRESAYEEEGETGAVKTQKLPTGGAQSCDPSQPDAERSDDSSRCQQQQREESRKQEKPSEEVKRKRELDQQEETVKRRGKPGGKAVGIQTASKKCSHAKEEHPIEQDEAERIKGALEENWDTIRIETINVTSLITNGWIALRRKSHVQLLQETCISVLHKFKADAKKVGKTFEGGPTDPEHGRPSAGVGALAYEGLKVYQVTNPTKDYLDAVATGRCIIICMDLGGTTLSIACIYGWTGAKQNTSNAERTNDIISIVQLQFERMSEGPKAIVGDLNGDIEDFPTLGTLLKDQGWMDVGNDPAKCNGLAGQATCHNNHTTKETRIDYFFANEYLIPAIKKCEVDNAGDFPTHKPLIVEVMTDKLINTTNQINKPTNYAMLFEEKVQREFAAAVKEHEERPEEVKEKDTPKTKGPNEGAIRKANEARFQAIMDRTIEDRRHRFNLAEQQKNTTRQWDLVAAAVEEACIEFFELDGKQATKMRGRSKIIFRKQEKHVLEGIEKEQTNEEAVLQAEWLRNQAEAHTILGNKITNVARRMKAGDKHGRGQQSEGSNRHYNQSTIKAYEKVSGKMAKNRTMTQEQKDKVEIKWRNTGSRKIRKEEQRKQEDEALQQHIEEIEQAATEFHEMAQEVETCDIDNVIHSAKLTRLGSMHHNKAKSLMEKCKRIVKKAKTEENSKGGEGIRKISNLIGEAKAKALTGIERDKDMSNGGRKGEITTNPREVDAIVKRAWKAIFDGIGGNIEEAVDKYLEDYRRYIYKGKEYQVQRLTGTRVKESFGRIKESAGALDGWSPKELSLLSHKACERVAVMYNQIEEGASWPRSAPHARVAYLEKNGAPAGKVMSFRPLTISAPIYRAYATMRLEDIQPWVQEWGLPEMHAGVPGVGAADAWHEATTEIEELKINDEGFCGAVADIAKFFDQIRRLLVYKVAKAAGMPEPVLRAYQTYVESLLMYNCLAGGVGTPYKRKCGIPQGCPFSMLLVALIMRPWIIAMRGIQGTMAYILADDVFILCKGDHMTKNLATAIDTTHEYLHKMGARVAPDKSYNFTNRVETAEWLAKTWWHHIDDTIEVVKDFRYLGAHLTAKTGCKSNTLEQRWEKAVHQLQRMKHIPATVEAKVRAIHTKVYAGGLYGIEASQLPISKVAKLAAMVINVFRSKNDDHNADRFFSTITSAKNEMDPMAQIFARRALQMRRTSAKKAEAPGKYERMMAKYAENHTVNGKIPDWYHPIGNDSDEKPKRYPNEQPHPTTKDHDPKWADQIQAEGPVGLLIESAAWHGVAIDGRLRLWQKGEEPVDILKMPYQNLKESVLAMPARARNKAE